MSDRTMPLRSVDMIDVVQSTENNLLNHKKIIPMFDQKNMDAIRAKILSAQSKPMAKPEVEVFFTKDQELLNQYYELRTQAYREENGWKKYDGSESECDRNSRIIVAVKNGKVIGGTKLMFSDENKFLSNEIPDTDFNYKSIIQKYDKRENLIFSEISSVVVVKGERDRSVSTKMFKANLEESKKHGCHYICGVGVAVVCRDYRRIFKELGYFLEIVISRPWQTKDTYNFARMFPMHVGIS